MKKLVALFLAVLMIFGATVPVFATDSTGEKHEKSPIIYISGSSIDLYDGEGNLMPTGFDVLTDDSTGDSISKDKIIESTVNILLPFLIAGLPMDKWDTYGDALYEELAPIWEETALDGNGDAKNGSGVHPDEIAKWDKKASTVDTGADGYFALRDYDFRYDWRLSPYDHVDRLHEYIETILETTGCEQVCLVARCIGGSLISAYLEKYGHLGLVKKVFYDEVMSNGSAVFSDCFSGKIKFSDKHAQSYIKQAEVFGAEGVGIDIALSDFAVEIIDSTMDLLNQTGVTTEILGGVEDLYNRLYHVLIPSLLLASGMGTWANYWCSVYEEDFDTALDLVFGKEGSERREEYAGLIAKVQYYREHITQKAPDVYKTFADEYGVEIGIMASYGLANAPIIEHYDETGDVLVGVTDASFGATAGGLYTTLSQEYIDSRVAEGFGAYISPDGKIDASTCLFPETTWFVKNKHHDYWSSVEYIATYFTQYSNVTASYNERGISRFLVHDTTAKGQIANMTEENMADGVWLDVVEQEPTKETRLQALMRFLKAFLMLLEKLFSGEINLSGLFG